MGGFVKTFLKAIALAAFVFAASASHAEHSDDMNFRFNPLGLVIGAIGVNFDIAVTDDWTVGPEGLYWHLKFDNNSSFNDFEISAFSVGARANWFKNGVFTDGLYVGPSVKYFSIKATSTDATTYLDREGTASALAAVCLVGYGWFWDSFNMMLGGGLSLPLGNNKVEVTDAAGVKREESVGGGFAAEFTLGWTF